MKHYPNKKNKGLRLLFSAILLLSSHTLLAQDREPSVSGSKMTHPADYNPLRQLDIDYRARNNGDYMYGGDNDHRLKTLPLTTRETIPDCSRHTAKCAGCEGALLGYSLTICW